MSSSENGKDTKVSHTAEMDWKPKIKPNIQLCSYLNLHRHLTSWDSDNTISSCLQALMFCASKNSFRSVL